MTGATVGHTLLLDTGANIEKATISAVGTAAASTTLAAPSSAGDSNIQVASVANLGAGAPINVDTAGNLESKTIGTVGTAAGAATTTSPRPRPATRT